MTGLSILNVGEGDTKITFDPKKPEERKRAAKVVEDLLERGFAIMVQVGTKKGKPLYQRAEAFDPDTCEYIVVGIPDTENDDKRTENDDKRTGIDDGPPLKHGRKGPRTRHRVPAESTPAVAISRSAGG